MCIRDRSYLCEPTKVMPHELGGVAREYLQRTLSKDEADRVCLLYTSDAADERPSVALGGRRIIKKKTKKQTRVVRERRPHEAEQ